MLLFVGYYFAGGVPFLAGAAILAIAAACMFAPGGRWARIAARLAAIVAVGLIVPSSTPMPLWLAWSWAGVWAAWMVCESLESGAERRAAMALRTLLIIASVTALAIEAPHHLTPKLPPGRCERICVIGDSISAGIGRETRTWPALLGESAQVEVTNYAVAGATIRDALYQARKLPDAEVLVIIEIGANDILTDWPSEYFERDLRDLLSAVRSPGRTVVMLELPLPVFSSGYGRAQRRLAEQYGVTLIPKRLFARILASPGATVDGLHLSDPGHKRMAETIWSVVGAAMVSGRP